MRSQLQRIGVTAAIAAMVAGAAAHPAMAFELFGIRLFGSKQETTEEVIGTPQFYNVEMTVGGGDKAVEDALRGASMLLADKDKPASGSAGLIGKARSDYERLLAALYTEAYYGGAISIRIDGREAGELPPDATLSDPATVQIVVDTGPQFRFGETTIVNRAPPPSDKDDIVPLAENEGFSPGEIARSGVITRAGRLSVEAWRQQGYAKARLADRRVEAAHDTATLDARLVIEPGRKAYYGPVTVEGAERMDPAFIAYMTGLTVGEEYDPDDIEEAEKRLQRLEVFASARAQPDERIGPGGALPIAFVVQERLPRRFGIGGTLSTVDGAGFEAYWLHRNLFGRAERLRLDAKIAGIGGSFSPDDFTYRVGASFVKPGVFTPDTNFSTSVVGIREDLELYTRTAVIAKSGFTHMFSKQLSGGIFVTAEQSHFRDIFGRRDFTTVGLEGTLTHDTRDNKIDATSGHFVEVVVEPFHEFHFGNTGVRSTLEGRVYVAADKEDRLVFAGRLKLGSLAGVPIAQTPPDKLFFAGGGGSVRGYAYNNIGIVTPAGVTGGRSLVEGSVEARTRVTDTIGVVGFLDFGQVTAATFPDFSGQFQFGAGAGLRYQTGLGPLRLDVAVPLNRRPGDPSVAAYIGIGQAF